MTPIEKLMLVVTIYAAFTVVAVKIAVAIEAVLEQRNARRNR